MRSQGETSTGGMLRRTGGTNAPRSAARYSGADRRRDRSHPLTPSALSDAVVTAAVACAGVAAVLAARYWEIELFAGEALWLLAVLCYAFAGALAIIRWRLVGETWSALVGVLWLHSAVAVLPVTAVAALIAGEEGPGPLLPTAALVLAVQAALARPSPAVDTAFNPWLRLAAGLAATSALGAALVRVPFFAEETGDGVGLLATACALTSAAVLVSFPGDRSRSVLGRRAGLSLIAAGIAQVALLSSPRITDSRFLLAGTIQFAGGLLAARAVAPHIGVALRELRRYEGVAARQWLDAHESVLVRQEQAHDLRSALLAIEGAVYSLRVGPAGSEHSELVGAVTEQVRLAQSILGTELPSAYSATNYDLTGLLTRLVLMEQANSRPVSCRVTENITAHGHPAAVAEILTNLFDNAARHAPRAAVDVTARVVNGRSVQVIVTDSGPPVPPEVIERLFELGWRRDHDREGSGLGLASCDRLARAEGGSITAAAGPRGGLRVVLSLPTRAPTTQGRSLEAAGT